MLGFMFCSLNLDHLAIFQCESALSVSVWVGQNFHLDLVDCINDCYTQSQQHAATTCVSVYSTDIKIWFVFLLILTLS